MPPKITVTKDGPYQVEGGVRIARQHVVTNEAGESLDWREGEMLPPSESCALCRCGKSRTKPFCDSTHAKVRFDGTETASRDPFAGSASWKRSRADRHAGRGAEG